MASEEVSGKNNEDGKKIRYNGVASMRGRIQQS